MTSRSSPFQLQYPLIRFLYILHIRELADAQRSTQPMRKLAQRATQRATKQGRVFAVRPQVRVSRATNQPLMEHSRYLTAGRVLIKGRWIPAACEIAKDIHRSLTARRPETMLRICIIGILSGLSLCSSAAAAAENITSDTYFYGQSSPVYPSRTSTSATRYPN